MDFKITSFKNGANIPNEYAFCVPGNPVEMGPNKNPHLKWGEPPKGTKSFVILCVDPYVPSKGDDVNQEGKEVPADLERVDFYHWVLVDIPADTREIPEGADSNGITAKGKAIGKTEYGVTGINNYTQWFAGDKDMEGNYGGYDGPCPPWNDSIVHHYYFKLFALDVASLQLSGEFTGENVKKAIQGHILAEAAWVGAFTLNKRLL